MGCSDECAVLSITTDACCMMPVLPLCMRFETGWDNFGLGMLRLHGQARRTSHNLSKLVIARVNMSGLLLQQYNLRKKSEHAFKSLVLNSKLISVMDPESYAERFCKSARDLFAARGMDINIKDKVQPKS